MNIIRVAPISKGIKKEELSYFSSAEFNPGEIIMVPLRNKEIPGIVLGSSDVLEHRSELRKADFNLKKINQKKGKVIFSSSFIEAVESMALDIGSTTGAILDSITPKTILNSIDEIKAPPESKKTNKPGSETLILQASEDERFDQYKNLTRESFARHESIFICVSTINQVDRVSNMISKGIEKYVFNLSSKVSKKELIKRWNEACESKHPVVIVGTGQFLSIPRNDMHTIVLEGESSRSYKNFSRPFLDIRTFAEHFIKKIHGRLVLADTVLRIETIWRYRNKELLDLYPPKFRYSPKNESSVVDMKTYKNLTKNKAVILSDELYKLIEKGGKTFIYVARKGLYPVTICADCGNTVMCEKCDSPVVVHNHKKTPIFVCHSCGKSRTTEERCKKCDSWKLQTMGVGIDLVHQNLRKKYPELEIFQIDKNTTKTHNQAKKVKEAFYKSKNGVLLGTEMSLVYLEEVDQSAIVSIDSLFALPDFAVGERIFSILINIMLKTTNQFLVQVRNSDVELINWATKGDVSSFYKREVKERELFDYPPFKRLVKVSIAGTKHSVDKRMTELANTFKEYNPEIFPAFTSVIKGKEIMHMLIRADKDAFLKLANLPPGPAINVDPLSIL